MKGWATSRTCTQARHGSSVCVTEGRAGERSQGGDALLQPVNERLGHLRTTSTAGELLLRRNAVEAHIGMCRAAAASNVAPLLLSNGNGHELRHLQLSSGTLPPQHNTAGTPPWRRHRRAPPARCPHCPCGTCAINTPGQRGGRSEAKEERHGMGQACGKAWNMRHKRSGAWHGNTLGSSQACHRPPWESQTPTRPGSGARAQCPHHTAP